MSEQEYWAIKTPKGAYERTQRATDEKDIWRRVYLTDLPLISRRSYVYEESFEAYRQEGENLGYRAVKVRIEEVEE